MLWGVNILSNVSSLALIVCDLQYLEDWEEKADGLTDLINHEGVCRTAPAKPGLLNTERPNKQKNHKTLCIRMLYVKWRKKSNNRFCSQWFLI